MTELPARKKTAYMGLLLSFALILSYVESLIPLFFGVPGMKLGLANLAVLLALYLFGGKEALLLNVLRILLSSVLFGNMSMFFYSAAGGLFSFFVMLLMKKMKKFSMIGVSMSGGVFHNIGQVLVAFAVVRTEGIFYYVPALLVMGVVTGGLNGIIAAQTYPYLSGRRNGGT